MNQLRVSTRLVLLVAVLAVMTLAIGALGLFEIRELNGSMRSVYEDRTVPIDQLAHNNALQLSNRLALTNALLQTLPAAEAVAQIEANVVKANKVWDAYMATQMTADEVKLAKASMEARNAFVQEGLGHMEVDDRDALVHGIFLLPRRGLHLLKAAAYDHLHIGTTEAS